MAAAVGDRNVRPRVEAPPEAAAAQLAAAAPARSPLLTLLDRAVLGGKVVKDPSGQVYTGFACYRDLAGSQCAFVPMNSNRAINREVVQQRVQENIEAYDRSGQYLEFGQINLIIVSRDPSLDFLVMDGQHRCETMRDLNARFPERELWFQFRVKVVTSEPMAFEELRHFQRSYPTDPRSFFRSRAEARRATAVLLQLKVHGPLGPARAGHGRPFEALLNDNLIFWLLQDSELLGGAEDGRAGAPKGTAEILADLGRMDQLLAGLPLAALGRAATEHMRTVAGRCGCWLGFLREGMLRWRDLQDRLVPDVPRPREEAQEALCTICLEGESTTAMLPCGHRCVCGDCAAAVRAAAPGDLPHVQASGGRRMPHLHMTVNCSADAEPAGGCGTLAMSVHTACSFAVRASSAPKVPDLS
eukprot:CAMPEP_0168432612 /NCGR_PEP_ID=MMETSP0228-20121227/38976_1 /TAXON_ID=133427 /ORGANISM="Protoceratium reticulatum, Strain CCCM 535 (=CCMP 1889)" /LENGTH=414 /DNA_ID=CAMNT_0008446735 /DNA_START=42 /DNA_END=1283 /DNA_ORIENTATION=-